MTVSPVTGFNAPHLYMPWCWDETEIIWTFPDGSTKYSSEKRRNSSSSNSTDNFFSIKIVEIVEVQQNRCCEVVKFLEIQIKKTLYR